MFHSRRLLVLCGSLLVATGLPALAEEPASVADLVAGAVCDKQLVVLGELPSHGEAQTFQIKAAIADRLIERCGFDALFFEAGVYDFLGFQEKNSQKQATPEQLDQAIGGFWKTRELAEWRRGLYDRAAAGRLVLGGLDDQPSASAAYARAILPDLVAAANPELQADECREAVVRNLNWRYDEQYPINEEEQRRLERCTRQAAGAGHEGGELSIEQQKMLENIASYYARQVDPSSATDRDEVMARNFHWQAQRMSAESKLMVWTSTVHAARQQGELRHRPLGAWLADTWADRLAVVGFTAFAGESSMAGGPIRPISEAPPDSLEAKATAADKPWSYLDRAALGELGRRTSRLFGRWTEADWSAAFDGVVVIRQETAPTFDR